MRIAFYCPNKPLTHPHPSGDLVIARGIRQSLRDQGHLCEEIVQFRARWFWKSPGGWVGASASLLRALWRTRLLNPEIWLTYHSYYKSPDVIGPWVTRILGIPYVLFQPMYATKYRKDPATRAGFRLNRWALRGSDHVFINNINDMEAMKRVCSPGHITYLPPGIFPEEFQRDAAWGRRIRKLHGISAGIPVVMTACRFRPGVKLESLEFLFNALSLLKKRGNAFELLVVGDGPAEESVRSMARELLPGCAVFAGAVPREEMAHFYSAADVFAFPGIGESLGMVYLEAQACGVPVVALETAGASQVVKGGETGILVPEDSGESMSWALERLIGEKCERVSMGWRGMEYVRRERNLHINYLKLSQILNEIVR